MWWISGDEARGDAVKAVLFDLLSALLDSWSLWDDIAGSEERGPPLAFRVPAAHLRDR